MNEYDFLFSGFLTIKDLLCRMEDVLPRPHLIPNLTEIWDSAEEDELFLHLGITRVTVA